MSPVQRGMVYPIKFIDLFVCPIFMSMSLEGQTNESIHMYLLEPTDFVRVYVLFNSAIYKPGDVVLILITINQP